MRITGGKEGTVINLDFEAVMDKIDNASDKNKKKFIEENCKDRDFLKNILIKKESYYNKAVQKILGEPYGLLKSGFLVYPDEKYYGTKNMDTFLDRIENIVKEDIKKDIELNRKKIEELQLLQK